MSDQLFDLAQKLFDEYLPTESDLHPAVRNPVHVVYGGADRFSAETPTKFGRLALRSLETFAPNFVEFANAFWLSGCDTLPIYEDAIADIEFRLIDDAEGVKAENYPAWFAWTIYDRTIQKLKREPVEDFRIDFEDGYGIRSDEEEDKDALTASAELTKTSIPFCGFRIKSFQRETYHRSIRTLELFLSNLLSINDRRLPDNFVVTLPKITRVDEVMILDKILSAFEIQKNLPTGSIKIEIMIETPFAVKYSDRLVNAANGRCVAAHFGAYDYTAGFGITALYQHLKHDTCDFARNLMQVNLSAMGVRMSDSVTTEMPIPVHKGENLSRTETAENKSVVQKAWRKHFNNITHSQINGFYQSWDLHPSQLVARYAAVYAFFLESFDQQADRLTSFLHKATRATLSGNQFDDAASAQGLINYFMRGLICGALSEVEVFDSTTLTIEELRSGSFGKIMQRRS